MFEWIGLGEIINIFILPFIGLIMSIVWFFYPVKDDRQE